MKITYVRENNEYRDEIIIPGAVTEDIKLVVWINFIFHLIPATLFHQVAS